MKLNKEKLSELSRDEKLKLLDAVKEKRRRNKIRKPAYEPNKGQMEIHKSDALDRWVFSGNGFGKTCAGTHEAVWAAQGYNPITKEHTKVPAKIVVLLDAPSKVEDVWLEEMRNWFDTSEWEFKKDGKPYISRIIFKNGSQILFMFHQQEAMVFESIQVSMVIADEPPPRHAFIGLKRGARRKGHTGRFLMIGTPIAASWIREMIYEPWSRGELPDTECYKFSTYMNEKNLKEGYLQEFTRHLTEKEKRSRLEGDFWDVSGLALAHLFSRHRHICEPFEWPKAWPTVIAIDPAMAKPHVACLMGVNPDGYLYYIDELSIKCAPKEFAVSIRDKWLTKYPVIDIVCDSFGSANHTGGDELKSFIDVLNENGVRARPTTFKDKDDENWIQAIQEVLELPDSDIQPPKFRIFEGNHGIVADIENVQWLQYKNQDLYKPKLDITKKDFLACVKYALATRLSFSKKSARVIKTGRSSLSWRNRDIY